MRQIHSKEETVITNDLLNDTFSDVNRFVGSEDTIHAQLYHNLLQHKVSLQELAREWRPKKHPYDMAILPNSYGQFKQFNDAPSVLVEVKGGAYNTRNALHDRITLDGYCEDHKYLNALPDSGVEKWFIVVDMSEMGRAILPMKKSGTRFLGDLASQSTSRLINMAYFCQGDDKFYVSRHSSEMSIIPLRQKEDSGIELNLFDTLTTTKSLKLLRSFTENITGHESNYTAYLYHTLRNSGYSPRQISLETYFKFAPRQQRPDITVYSSNYDGKFNLYPKGDSSRTNDLHKCQNLRGIVEVKAKQPISSYISDVIKLAEWRKVIVEYHSSSQPEMIFIAFDTRHRKAPSQDLEELASVAKDSHIRLIYLSRTSVEMMV